MSKPTNKQPAVEQDSAIPAQTAYLLPKDCLKIDVPCTNDKAIAWHPKKPSLAVATGGTLCEFDVLSGCRCNIVELVGTPLKLQYTPDGGSIVLFTRERTMYSWSTSSWRRRLLLPPEARYAGRVLLEGLMAVSGGQQPIIYYTVRGKNSVRSVHTAAPEGSTKGVKLERHYMPGYKLKTENKKPIVGLAVHPFDQHMIIVLLGDGTMTVFTVAGGTMTPTHSLAIPAVSTEGSGSGIAGSGLRAIPHPLAFGGALLVVEGPAGFTLVDLGPRQEPYVISTQALPPGMLLCGTGLITHSLLFTALARHASGNVQVLAWRLVGDKRGLLLLPVTAFPSTIWDAFQGPGSSGAAGPSLAAVSGDRVVMEGMVHPGTGHLALVVWHRLLQQLNSAGARAGKHGPGPLSFTPAVPLLQLVAGADVAGTPTCVPLHSGLGFWSARDNDETVSKLRFPRYAHLISTGKLCMYDLTHGLISDYLIIPLETSQGSERRMRRVVHSTKQAAWLVFAEVLTSSRTQKSDLLPGQFEWTLVPDKEAASTERWFMPGASGAFVGGRDDLVVILSNSGRSVSVYETAKLQAGPKPLYTTDLAEGQAAGVHQGPPSFLPAPPPEPEEEEGEGSQGDAEEEVDEDDDSDAEEAREAKRQERLLAEQRRLELPRRVLVHSVDNRVYLVDIPRSGPGYQGGQVKALQAKQSLQLRQGEALVQVAWQTLSETEGGFHTGNSPPPAAACAAALLTTERCLLVDSRLRTIAAASLAPDLGLPVSCLWVGPALLVSTAGNQVLQVCWDGKAVHLCSLLSPRPQVLTGALADRLLLASRPPGGQAADVAGRAFSVLQPMVLGWATLAARKILPGGASRIRQELRTLVGSYDACQLSVGVLEALAGAGFADVAAAVAARSESPAVTPSFKSVLAAAAGDWEPLINTVLGEWERSPHHPNPPPKASPLHSKLVALARALQAHGRFTLARRLLEAAGAWNELLALCVFQGDFMGLQSYARLGGRDVQRLADQLLAVNEDAFRHSSGGVYGGRPNAEDWQVEVKGDANLEEGDDIDVAPAGRLPFMEASLQVRDISSAQPAAPAMPAEPAEGTAQQEDEGIPIKGLELGALEAYVGVAGASVVRAPPTGLGTGAPGVAAPATPTSGSEAGFSMSAAVGVAAGAGAEGGSTHRSASGWESVEGGDREGSMRGAREGETQAQAAARAQFRRDTADDEDDFFSSDEDDFRPEYDTRSQTSLSTTTTSTQQRFKIMIRSPDQPAAGDASALRAAAQGLKLGALASPSASQAGSSRLLGPPSGAASPSLRRLGSAASDAQGTARPGTAPKLAPPPGSVSAASMTRATSSASSAHGAMLDDPFASLAVGGGGKPATPQPAVAAHDPFTFGSTSGAGASAPDPSPSPPRIPKPPSYGSLGSGQPMRAPSPTPAPAADLLSGWEDFEAMFGGSSSAAPAPAVPSPPARPPAKSPAKAHSGGASQGMQAFHAGDWEAACSKLAQEVKDARGGTQAVAYYVAARLMAAGARISSTNAAKLARFAVCLPLDDSHRLGLVVAAVERNMAAQNFGYAAEQLTWLILQSTSAPGSFPLSPQDLQDRLNACDRAGGKNANLAAGEDPEMFRTLVGSCGSLEEGDDLVETLVRG